MQTGEAICGEVSGLQLLGRSQTRYMITDASYLGSLLLYLLQCHILLYSMSR